MKSTISTTNFRKYLYEQHKEILHSDSIVQKDVSEVYVDKRHSHRIP